MLVLGGSLFTAGTTCDLIGNPLLGKYPYLSNILVGFTGFLIGVPVALVGLSSITTQREEQATLDRVNRLSRYAWFTFREQLNKLASDERCDALNKQARDVRKYYDEVYVAFESILSYVGGSTVGFSWPNAAVVEIIDGMRQIEPKFRAALNSLTNTFGFQSEDEWAQISGSWRILDEYVRLQRLEQGLEWFNDDSDAGLRKWMNREFSPVENFIKTVEVRAYTAPATFSVSTMRSALDAFNSYVSMQDTELVEYLIYTGNIFTEEASINFNGKLDACLMFFYDLKRYIGLIESQYWPRGYTNPKEVEQEPELTMTEYLASIATPEGAKQFEKQLKGLMAERYLEKLRRRPKGNRSGSDLREQ